MKKEIEYNNIIIQEDKDLGSTVEAYNPDNLSAEKILEDSKKKKKLMSITITQTLQRQEEFQEC